MTDVRVWVALPGADVPVGMLYNHRRRGVESSTLIYDSTYLDRPEAYALDPELPLVSGSLQTRVGRELFGALTDCSPDRWGRTLLNRREAVLAREERRAARRLGELDYLLGVRDDLRQGALRFTSGQGPFLAEDDTGVPALTDLPALMDLAQRAETDTADLPDLQRLVQVGSSLGGARPKAHVRDSNGRVAIAKFPSANRDTWNVMAWEKVALDLAEKAGVEVPRSRLLKLAGRNVLVVDRFDRAANGQRIGYVSAMTKLEASDGEQRSYLEIGEVIEAVSARARAELHQLWRRLVLSILVSNTDDHLRNHGFLHSHGDIWRLAPAFDINPNPAPGPRYLSTAVDDSGEPASLASALTVAGFFRLNEAEAHRVLDQVRSAVAQWPTVAGRHGLTGSEQAEMAPAFSAMEAGH